MSVHLKGLSLAMTEYVVRGLKSLGGLEIAKSTSNWQIEIKMTDFLLNLSGLKTL